MNRFRYRFISIASFITIAISILGIFNIYSASDDGVTYSDTADGKVIVKYVEINKPGYVSDIQIGDTVYSINGRVPRSMNDLKSNIIEKSSPGTVLMYGIGRRGHHTQIAVQITNRYSLPYVLYQIVFFILFFSTSLIFLITFPSENNFPFYVFMFYVSVVITHIFSRVSFANPFLYSILIISGSFCPAMMFLLIFFYKDNAIIKRNFIFLMLPSSVVFLLWLSFYLVWAKSMMPADLSRLLTVAKITQFMIACMFTFAVIVLLRSIYRSLKDDEKYHITYITTFLISGFIPYVILYAFPMALGKKEILSVEKTISFAIIPLIGIVVFNNLFYRRK